jgi:hypothetical protein
LTGSIGIGGAVKGTWGSLSFVSQPFSTSVVTQPSTPMLDTNGRYPGRYGFGALRCAIDNLNGDNVEAVDFPSGSHHGFCYAYYVIPPPSSGTLIIRKEVRDAPNASESFVMGGNISYDRAARSACTSTTAKRRHRHSSAPTCPVARRRGRSRSSQPADGCG